MASILLLDAGVEILRIPYTLSFSVSLYPTLISTFIFLSHPYCFIVLLFYGSDPTLRRPTSLKLRCGVNAVNFAGQIQDHSSAPDTNGHTNGNHLMSQRGCVSPGPGDVRIGDIVAVHREIGRRPRAVNVMDVGDERGGRGDGLQCRVSVSYKDAEFELCPSSASAASKAPITAPTSAPAGTEETNANANANYTNTNTNSNTNNTNTNDPASASVRDRDRDVERPFANVRRLLHIGPTPDLASPSPVDFYAIPPSLSGLSQPSQIPSQIPTLLHSGNIYTVNTCHDITNNNRNWNAKVKDSLADAGVSEEGDIGNSSIRNDTLTAIATASSSSSSSSSPSPALASMASISCLLGDDVLTRCVLGHIPAQLAALSLTASHLRNMRNKRKTKSKMSDMSSNTRLEGEGGGKQAEEEEKKYENLEKEEEKKEEEKEKKLLESLPQMDYADAVARLVRGLLKSVNSSTVKDGGGQLEVEATVVIHPHWNEDDVLVMNRHHTCWLADLRFLPPS